ncbi:MAG: RIO1 family regulatory kinase/ATPase domain-containing protein [Promethearchaeota archaeon]
MDHFALVATLEKEEFRVLNAIEISMRKFGMVPFKNITFYTRYDPEEVQYWLDVVHKKELIIRDSEKRQRYVLNSKGYDLLALKTLAERDVVASIGNMLGTGKESDVYQAIAPSGKKLALKFHRIGRTSFRAIKQKRDYATGKHHVSWLYLCRLSATKEAKFLEKLMGLGLKVPLLVNHNRHVVVMDLFEGQEIHEFPKIDDPEAILVEILLEVKKIYQDARLIHGDLGEFNIIYTFNGRILIIDWPQAVNIDHPNAQAFIRRDVENILLFFQRKYSIERDIDVVLREITGQS